MRRRALRPRWTDWMHLAASLRSFVRRRALRPRWTDWMRLAASLRSKCSRRPNLFPRIRPRPSLPRWIACILVAAVRSRTALGCIASAAVARLAEVFSNSDATLTAADTAIQLQCSAVAAASAALGGVTGSCNALAGLVEGVKLKERQLAGT